MCLSLSLSELNCFGLVRVVLLFYLHVRGFGFCVGRGFTYFEDDGKRVGKERWCCSCLVFFSFLSLFFSWGVFMNLFFFGFQRPLVWVWDSNPTTIRGGTLSLAALTNPPELPCPYVHPPHHPHTQHFPHCGHTRPHCIYHHSNSIHHSSSSCC